MNTKKLLLPTLLVCVALACALTGGSGLGGGVPGSGNVQTEKRDTDAFESISVEYPGSEIIVEQGDQETVEIEADDNLLPQLSTEVISGKLTIKNMETDWKAMVNPSKPVKISITVKELNEIILPAPVGDLEVNGLQAGVLKLVLSGGAQIKLKGIQVNVKDGTGH